MAAFPRPLLGALMGLLLGVASADAQPPSNEAAQFERLQGFSTVVINHVNSTFGTELLPVTSGGGVEPGVFVSITLDKVQIFDRDAAALHSGRVADPTVAAECESGCPAALFDAFQEQWLELAVESSTFAVEIPTRVLLAAHRELPAATVLQVAYAAAETHPIAPPQLALLVNNTRGSLRSRPFFLVPPRGIELRQGSAALGLTVKVSPTGYLVSAADPRFARELPANSPAALRTIARDIKKRYPGKETVILVPEGDVRLRELMAAASILDDSFPRLVLSAGQEVRVP